MHFDEINDLKNVRVDLNLNKTGLQTDPILTDHKKTNTLQWNKLPREIGTYTIKSTTDGHFYLYACI